MIDKFNKEHHRIVKGSTSVEIAMGVGSYNPDDSNKFKEGTISNKAWMRVDNGPWQLIRITWKFSSFEDLVNWLSLNESEESLHDKLNECTKIDY